MNKASRIHEMTPSSLRPLYLDLWAMTSEVFWKLLNYYYLNPIHTNMLACTSIWLISADLKCPHLFNSTLIFQCLRYVCKMKAWWKYNLCISIFCLQKSQVRYLKWYILISVLVFNKTRAHTHLIISVLILTIHEILYEKEVPDISIFTEGSS